MTMLTAPLIQLTLAGNYVVLIITSASHHASLCRVIFSVVSNSTYLGLKPPALAMHRLQSCSFLKG